MNNQLIISSVAFITIIFLCSYSYIIFDEQYPSIKSFNSNPNKYGQILIEKTGMMHNLTSNNFYLEVTGNIIEVKYEDKVIRETNNGPTTIVGLLDKRGFISLEKIHYNNNLYIKYLISFLAVIIFLCIFIKEWKLSERKFIIKNA